MEVEKIIEKKENLLEFLKEKGFVEETDYSDEEYKEGYYFKIDKRKLLVVYEINDEEKLKEIKDHFLIDRGLSYCIIVFNHRIIFFRSFGETKHFLYSERTKTKVSKIDRIKKIDKEGFDFIFQAGKDISQQFYESFKLKRDLLASSIKTEMEYTQKYLIAQKIFDRFFFIYFLCHKKLVKANNRSISGKNLFSEILLKQKEFLPNLKNLFDKFNLQGKGESRILKINDYKLFVPYLNGGLFRPDVLEEDLKISLSKNQWSEIFVFLNSYHWIIEDIRSLDDIEESEQDSKKEGYLTPEILGHVYERSVVEWEQKGFDEEAKKAVNKISEKKRKGVYYTPEAITDYISNNTITPYLLDKLENKYENFDSLIETINNNSDIKKAIKILDEIKILDPACGSGAFLIKSSEILFHLKRRLNYALGNKNNFYTLKLNIVTDNIYGVDILKGATEISKLRLWLWLISDYNLDEEIEPLPNIEYNIMCGNSLVGFTSFKGKLVEVSSKLIIKIKRFEELKAEYKKSHGKTSIIIQELLEKEMTSVRSELNSLYIQDLNSREIDIFKVKQDTQINFFGEKTKIKSDKYIYQSQFEKELLPFHWVLEFSEAFKGDNPGFDIVIGNPPYISFGLRNVGKLPQHMKDFYNKVYSNSSEYKINIYPIFIQRGIDLTKENGEHSFIVPDSFLLGRYFSKVRSYILEKCKINKILFLPYVVFPGATIGVSIIYIFEKTKNNNGNMIKAILAYENSQIKNEGIKNYSYSQDYFKTIDYNRFRLFFDKTEFEIIKFIDKGEKLTENFGLYSGCIARYGQISLISETKKQHFMVKDNEKLIYSDDVSKNKWKKTIISGGEFSRYSKINPENYIYINKDINILRKITKSGFDFSKYENNKLFMRQTGDHITATYDDEHIFCLNNVHLVYPKNDKISLKYLLAILNSRIMEFYYKKITLEEGRTMAQIDIETAELLSINYLQDYEVSLNLLVDYNLLKQDKFIDELLIDCIIYEIYLKEKLQSNLLEKLKPLIKDISNIKDESEKIKIIEQFIDKVKSSKEIQDEIQKIRFHPWIKIIESKNEK